MRLWRSQHYDQKVTYQTGQKHSSPFGRQANWATRFELPFWWASSLFPQKLILSYDSGFMILVASLFSVGRGLLSCSCLCTGHPRKPLGMAIFLLSPTSSSRAKHDFLPPAMTFRLSSSDRKNSHWRIRLLEMFSLVFLSFCLCSTCVSCILVGCALRSGDVPTRVYIS